MEKINEDETALVLIGAVIARRAQQILGYEDEAVALAVTLATKQVVQVIEGSDSCLEALDEFEELEAMLG